MRPAPIPDADSAFFWEGLRGGRLLLQSYRFTRGGYRIVEAVQCRRESDDRLECMDSRR